MRKIYESFEELADEMCAGDGSLHILNCARSRHIHDGDTCVLWMTGVRAFAEWLDHIGVKVEVPDNAVDFYHFCAKKYPGEPE